MAPPTGAPGEEVESPAPGGRGGPGAPGGSEDERRWAAEAERLLADRPPHWG